MSQSLTPNAEQRAIIEAAAKGDTLVVNALAGTGKTTTLAMLAAAHPAKRILYLAFNRPIADEARATMPEGVDCKTFHSLAYGQMRPDRNRLSQRLNGRYVIDRFNAHALYEGKEAISAFDMGNLALATLSRYCASVDPRIGPEHVPDLMSATGQKSQRFGPNGPGEARMKKAAVALAEAIWQAQCDPQGDCPITHDGYVKRWALGQPRIKADLILFDEAQDASPVFIDIVERQSTQVVWVGDQHQQIYAWRGAENALGRVRRDQSLYLTASYRFPPLIASLANGVLGMLGEGHSLKGLGGGKGKDGSKAILTRTNVEAIKQFLEARDAGERVRLIGAGDMLGLVRHLESLVRGQPRGPFSLFQSYDELRDYARSAEGKDLSVMVKAVDEHGVNRLMNELEAAANTNPEVATLILSTLHKAKGQEFDEVTIADDWPTLDPENADSLDEAEKRLLYVGLTRARVGVGAASGIRRWLHTIGVFNEKGAVVDHAVRQAEPPSTPDVSDEAAPNGSAASADASDGTQAQGDERLASELARLKRDWGAAYQHLVEENAALRDRVARLEGLIEGKQASRTAGKRRSRPSA